jgi:cell division protein FtsN
MARRELPPTSRIFTRKRKWAWSRLTGSALLTAALLVMAFGIGTAVYLERPRAPGGPPATAASLPLTIAPAAPAHDPLAADAAVRAPAPAPPPAPATLAKLEPQAGPPTPAQPPQPVAAPAPPAATAAIAPPPRPEAAPAPAPRRVEYWVEYGVYRGPLYARRLQQTLARAGLPAVIVATHGRGGGLLLRVRSAPLDDLAAARQDESKARAALGIVPLLHRGSPATTRPEKRYWVQFGAFRKLRQAANLRRRLARVGVATTLSSTRGRAAKPFYLVRSKPLATHAMARALAARGEPVTEVASLIGVTPRAPRLPPPARAPPRPIADSR